MAILRVAAKIEVAAFLGLDFRSCDNAVRGAVSNAGLHQTWRASQ